MKITRLIALICMFLVSFTSAWGCGSRWENVEYNDDPQDCPDEYAAELINWKPYTMENDISPDVAKELLKFPADGGLSDLEAEYPSLNNRLREFYGDENPPLVQDIMRDLIFLKSIQDDIQTWEEQSGKGASFSEVYTTAQSIATDYQEYLTERKVSSVFGAVILSTLEGTINGEIKSKIKEIAKDQFLHTGYKVEPTKLIKGLATSFVKDVVKIGVKKFVGEKNAVFVDILTGNWIDTIIEGIIYIAEEPDNIYRGKLLLQYYYLMKKYGTKIMDDCKFAELEGYRGPQIKDSSVPYPCKTIEKDDERGQYLYDVDAAPAGTKYLEKNADQLGIAPSIHEMASLFLVIDNLDIEQLQKNLAAFAYAKYLARQQKAVFVVDTTGSMSPEISAVKTAISDHVGNLTDSSQRFGLITFKDDEVSHFFKSSTVNTVEILEASGGKDCEELSNAALLKASEPSSAFGRVVLITDASAKDYDNGAKVVKKAKEAFVAIDTIITGDCYLNVETPSKLKKRLTSKSGRVQYQAISKQTGGISFDIGKTEVDKILPISIGINGPNRADILHNGILLKNGETINPTRRKRDSKTRQSVEIPIDNTLSETVTFMLTGSSANALPVFTLTRPDGTVVQSTDSDVTYLQLSSVMSYAVENPVTGKWQASFEGNGEFLLSVFGDSALRLEEITLLSQTEEGSSPSPDALSPIIGELVGGSEIVVEVRFTAAPQTVSLSLLKLADESVISTPTVTAVDGEGSRYFQATITVPTEPFKLSFKGLTAEGSEFIRVMPVPLNPQSVKITATPPFAEAMPQTTANFEVTVDNLSDAVATYSITASNTKNWLVTAPATITVASGASKTVTVNVDIPANAVTDAINEVTITVEDTNDPTVGNNTAIWLKVAETIRETSQASCQLYAVHDDKRNDSQFFTVNPNDYQVNQLGPLHKGYDIEAIAVHPQTNTIYAVSGKDVDKDKPRGHLYVVDGQTGELFPIGSTGFKEIEDLAFGKDGTLWAWAKGDGMITIDLATGVGTLQIDYDAKVEGLTLSKNQEHIFYGAVGNELWVYDQAANQLQVACDNLPGETEALEMLPDGLLLMGIHKDKSASLHAFDVNSCQLVPNFNIPTHPFDDVEGMALPTKACTQ